MLSMLAVNFPISFDRPVWLWLLLAIPVMAFISMRTLSGLERPRRLLAIFLRSLVIAALAVALARIEYVKRNDHVAVMFLLDRSKSVPGEVQLKAKDYIKASVKNGAKVDRDAKFGVIAFDGMADVSVIPSRVGADILDFGIGHQPDRTNIAAGVRMAMAAFPEGYGRRMVLMTDGNQNAGDLNAEIEAAVANGVAVDVVPLQFRHENEILFDRLSVPAQVPANSQVPIRLIAKSTQPTRARITLYHNDHEVPLPDELRIFDLSGGMRPDRKDITIELRGGESGSSQGGVHRFDARLEPIDSGSDSVAENNRATGFTFVQDKGKILVLTMPNSQDEDILVDALRRELAVPGESQQDRDARVDKRGTDQFREAIDLADLNQYGAIILSNIPADEFNDQQHKALASYVRDTGGGLIMTGGENGFGAGGWIGKPLEEVSPVSFEIKQEKKLPRGALVIIMHSCEIDRGNYWGEQVAIAAVKTVSSLDYLGVLSFSYSPGGVNWDVPLKPVGDKNRIIRAITQMKNGDMPDYDTTMKMAVTDLMKLRDASQRHIIIISDGDPQPPSPEVIKVMVDNKITCSTVGIGYGAHVVEQTLRDIAVKTHPDGSGLKHFYRCTNPNLLPQIFVKEAKIVRRSLIQEQEFSPQLLLPYDQTVAGFENIKLPSLYGMVLTTPKPEGLVPMIRSSKDSTGKAVTDPVLAYWNCEMGKMAVYTSGYWKNWGRDWAGWESYGKFWAQLVRWAMRDSGELSFDIVTRLEGSRGKISIEATNKDASYVNNLYFPYTRVVTPSQEAKNLMLVQTGPGQYEGTFDVTENGNYLAGLTYADPTSKSKDGKPVYRTITTGLSVPYSPEFRELKTNMGLLDGVVQKSHGRMLAMDPVKDNVFSKNLPLSVSRQPVWRWVVQWLLLPLFLLDVAGRRLASALAMSFYVEAAVLVTLCATFYSAYAPAWAYVLALLMAEAVGWAIRWRYIMPTIEFFTYGVSALGRAGQRSTQSLSQLKNVREKVRGEIDGQQAGQAGGGRPSVPRPRRAAPGAQVSESIPLEPSVNPRKRFDVGDKAAAQPARDLTEAVGGAKAETPEEQAARKTGQGQSPGELTSRLLKAKQRAQEEIKDRKDTGG